MRQFTELEKAIAKCFDPKWKYMARDEDGSLYLFRTKPQKYAGDFGGDGCWEGLGYDFVMERLFGQRVFESIKWSDKEPTLIDDICNREVDVRNKKEVADD